MLRSYLILSAAAIALVAVGRTATADPIGPDCGTCQGSIYELLYNPTPVGQDADSTQYAIVLRINTAGYSGGGVNIDDVAFKISPKLDGLLLGDAPGGAGDWSAALGGINAGGCDGNANNGFGCATSNDDTNATLPFAGVYQWIFIADVPTGTLLTDPFAASIKARYVDANGDKIGDLVSEPISLQLIPEPGTALSADRGPRRPGGIRSAAPLLAVPASAFSKAPSARAGGAFVRAEVSGSCDRRARRRASAPFSARKRVPVPQKCGWRMTGSFAGSKASPLQWNQPSRSWSKTKSGLLQSLANSAPQPVPPFTVWSGRILPTT